MGHFGLGRPSFLLLCLFLVATTAQNPTPAPDLEKPDPQAVLTTLLLDLNEQLHRPTLQWVNALVMLCLGLVMVLDGRFVFKMIVTFAAGVFAFEMTLSELNQMQTSLHSFMTIVSGTEVGLVTAFVSYKGYEGVQYVLGIVAGGWAAWEIHHFALAHSFEYFNNGIVILLVANVCVITGMWLFGNKGHDKVVAVVCSILGGSFISSSLGYFLMLLLCSQRALAEEKLDLHLADSAGAWIDYWFLIATLHGNPIGAFANSSYNIPLSQTTKVGLDRILGLIIWVIFLLFGIWFQKRRAANKSERKPKKKGKVDEEGMSKVEEGRQPLLAKQP